MLNHNIVIILIITQNNNLCIFQVYSCCVNMSYGPHEDLSNFLVYDQILAILIT